MKRPSYLLRGVEAFKSNLRSKSNELEPGQVFAVRKEAAGGVAEGAGGKLDFILSTSAVDRSGDVVSQDGWHLDNYRKNPVVLWAHDQRAFPGVMAKAPDVVIENGQLKARGIVFADHEEAKTVEALYRGGFMSAVSVGFLPRKWVWNEDRGQMAMDFQEQELLEFSFVPVPANPEALVSAKSAGINLGPVVKWAEMVLEGEGKSLLVPREYVEQLWKAAKPSRTAYIMPAAGPEAGSEAPVAKADDAGEPEGQAFAEDALAEALEKLTGVVSLLCDAVVANTAETKALHARLPSQSAPATVAPSVQPTPVEAPTKTCPNDIARLVAAQVRKQLTASTGRID